VATYKVVVRDQVFPTVDLERSMLAEIDEALEWPITAFRPPTERLVGLGL